VKRKTVVRSVVPLFALLLVGALSLAQAAVLTTGVLSTGNHVVSGDSVTIFDMAGGFRTYVTTGWGGDTMVVDTTVLEPPMDAKPMIIMFHYTQDDSAYLLDMPDPVFDSWYILPGMPTAAQVMFSIDTMVGVDELGRTEHPRAGLIVSPSIVGTGATIRAERVAGTSCVFTLYDAAGNRVRTLRTQASAGAASATWNGNDDLGRRLPEGIYYCCLEDPANPTVSKLILTR